MDHQIKEYEKEDKKFFYIFLGIAFLIWLATIFSLAEEKILYVDEGVHIAQINLFLKGETSLDPKLTLIPGYKS